MASSFFSKFLSFLLLLVYVQAASSSTSKKGKITRSLVTGTGSKLRPTGTGTGTGGAFPIGSNTTWTSASLHSTSTSHIITTSSSTLSHHNGTVTSASSSSTKESDVTTSTSSIEQASRNTTTVSHTGHLSSSTKDSPTSSKSDTSISSSSSHSSKTDLVTTTSSTTSNSTSHSVGGSSSSSAGSITTGTTSLSKTGPTSKPGPTTTATNKPTSDSSSSTDKSSKTSPPLTHFTSFPTSASVSTISGNPTKSHVDVTSSGKVLHVPVLHNCWFCPPGGGAFALFGFAAPGVYPAGGPPAGFPTPFPEITVGPDGDPTFSEKPTNSPSGSASDTITSKPTSTTSDVCTTATVSDCSTSLSYGVSDGKTTTTATVTSCKPRVGCSVSGTDFTTATTSSANGTCWRYSYDNDADNDDGTPDEDDLNDDTGVIARRWRQGIAGRRALNRLQARHLDPEARAALIRRGAAVPVKKLSYNNGGATTCDLIIPTATGAGAAPASVTIPGYPGAADLEGHKPTGAIYWYVPTTSAKPGGCPTVTITTYSDVAALTAGPVITDSSGNGNVYQVGGNPPPGKPGVNVDHVYEQKFLQDFFQDALGSGQISCKDFNDFFMAYDSGAGNNVPRYQVIWDQIPSDSNPDFAGLDNWINKVKGFLFSPGLDGLRDPNKKKNKPWKDEDKIQIINEMAAAVDFTNRKEVADLFKKTNTRIFEAFRGIDNLITSLKGCGQTPPEPKNNPGKGWADVYSDYMENLIKTQNAAIESRLSLMTDSTFYNSPADPTVTGGVKAFTEAYPPSKWTFDAGALLEWPTTSALAIAKRDGAVCSLTKSPSASPSASPTGSPTPSGSKGGTSPSKPTSTQPPPSPTTTTSKAATTSSKPPPPPPTTTSKPPPPPPTTTKPAPPPAPPSTPPPAKDTCGDWYKVLFDHFEIYGKYFDASKFGDDGAGLKKQIQGCGDLTSWSFKELTDDPNGYQWYASGNLPIGTKACVGRAVVSGGGASADGCTGAG